MCQKQKRDYSFNNFIYFNEKVWSKKKGIKQSNTDKHGGHLINQLVPNFYLRAIDRVKMAHYTNIEKTDMVLMYGEALGNANAARRLYIERFPQREHQVLECLFTSAVVQHLRISNSDSRPRCRTASRNRAWTRNFKCCRGNPRYKCSSSWEFQPSGVPKDHFFDELKFVLQNGGQHFEHLLWSSCVLCTVQKSLKELKSPHLVC